MVAAAIRHRPYDIVICEPLDTDQRLVNCASRGDSRLLGAYISVAPS